MCPYNLHNSYLPASERTKWLYISVSAAMAMQNVVNPTFWERKSEYALKYCQFGLAVGTGMNYAG